MSAGVSGSLHSLRSRLARIQRAIDAQVRNAASRRQGLSRFAWSSHDADPGLIRNSCLLIGSSSFCCAVLARYHPLLIFAHFFRTYLGSYCEAVIRRRAVLGILMY